jgi:hypothetical protein
MLCMATATRRELLGSAGERQLELAQRIDHAKLILADQSAPHHRSDSTALLPTRHCSFHITGNWICPMQLNLAREPAAVAPQQSEQHDSCAWSGVPCSATLCTSGVQRTCAAVRTPAPSGSYLSNKDNGKRRWLQCML